MRVIDWLRSLWRSSSPGETAEEYFRRPDAWKPVQSSNVHSIGYFTSLSRGGGNVLGVRFLNGAEYHYYGVELATFTDFLVASSKGRFVWQRLRDKYRYKRVK